MKHTRTGQLKHRIVVKKNQTLVGEYDELGASKIGPVTIGTYWANVEARTGSLLKGRAADTVLTNTTHVITTRYHEAIDHTCWIEFKGHHFDIDYISDPDFSKTWMEIFVREVIA